MTTSELSKVQVIIGGHDLIEELVEARRSIAEGYTYASGSNAAERSFKKASEALERYIARVNHLLDEGRIAPETAVLFTSEANTLIAALAAL